MEIYDEETCNIYHDIFYDVFRLHKYRGKDSEKNYGFVRYGRDAAGEWRADVYHRFLSFAKNGHTV